MYYSLGQVTILRPCVKNIWFALSGGFIGGFKGTVKRPLKNRQNKDLYDKW